MSPKTVKTESKKEKKVPASKAAPKHEATRYFEARGGRKTAVSRVRLFPKLSGVTVNDKELKQYFAEPELQATVLRPLMAMHVEDSLGVTAKVYGGGLRGQAEAVSLGIARALTLFNEEFRKALRKEDLLTRDSRMVERKKYGLRKARRAPQWAKR